MHFTTLLTQTALATAVFGAGIPSDSNNNNNMGWRDSKAQALRKADAAKAKWAGSSGPVEARDWKDDLDAALERAKKATAAFNDRNNNNNNNNNDKRDAQMYGGDDDIMPANTWWATGAPQPTNAPGYPAGYYDANGGQKGWQDDASAWQAYGSSMGAEWQAYGSSVAASASAQYGAGGDWQSAASSAQSVASSYRSEYGVPAKATPTPSPTWAAKPEVGTVGIAGVATPTPNMVQVNGAVEGGAGIGAAVVLGAGAAVFAIAAGML